MPSIGNSDYMIWVWLLFGDIKVMVFTILFYFEARLNPEILHFHEVL